MLKVKGRDDLSIKLDKISRDLAHANSMTLKVGWLGAQYEGGLYVADIAARNEFGDMSRIPPIPARPFMRPAIAKNKTQWLSLFNKTVNRELSGERTATNALSVLGERVKQDIMKAIENVWEPALSTYTITQRARRRGLISGNVSRDRTMADALESHRYALTKPLIDTGRMINSITFKVE